MCSWKCWSCYCVFYGALAVPVLVVFGIYCAVESPLTEIHHSLYETGAKASFVNTVLCLIFTGMSAMYLGITNARAQKREKKEPSFVDPVLQPNKSVMSEEANFRSNERPGESNSDEEEMKELQRQKLDIEQRVSSLSSDIGWHRSEETWTSVNRGEMETGNASEEAFPEESPRESSKPSSVYGE